MTDLHRLVSLYLSRQFARFVFVGGVALVLNWLSRFAFNAFVGYGWAIVLAYLVGMIIAFMLNKLYVFPYSKRSLNFEIVFFSLVNIVAFPFVWIFAFVFGEWVLNHWIRIDLALAVAHGVAITLPVFVNFILHKCVTFREA